MAASRVVDLVTAEIASVTTQLRSDFRAAAAAYRAPPPSGTQLLHKFHAARRAVLQPGDVACTDYLAPFPRYYPPGGHERPRHAARPSALFVPFLAQGCSRTGPSE